MVDDEQSSAETLMSLFISITPDEKTHHQLRRVDYHNEAITSGSVLYP